MKRGGGRGLGYLCRLAVFTGGFWAGVGVGVPGVDAAGYNSISPSAGPPGLTTFNKRFSSSFFLIFFFFFFVPKRKNCRCCR